MKFGIYVHIPYCIQRCHYCDFVTHEQSKILPPEDYVNSLIVELKSISPFIPFKELTSIYFGGGTPSLIEPMLLKKIITEISLQGFQVNQDTEVTLEINPATVSEQNLLAYLDFGINRFSVGAQTFNDELLAVCGREHNAKDTRTTLDLLKKYNCNYSFDLLFALPNQSIDDLKKDLDEVRSYNPNHLSAYCLTLPSNHFMNQDRPSDQKQIDMFKLIETELQKIDIHKYEISNFAKKGFESKHNLLYWTDQAYWGLGLSSHSYLPNQLNPVRFWNLKHMNEYIQWCKNLSLSPPKSLLSNHASNLYEKLKPHESLTDFCHTHLRLSQGLSIEDLVKNFPQIASLALLKLRQLESEGLLKNISDYYSLTASGNLISNLVFERLYFSEKDCEMSRK